MRQVEADLVGSTGFRTREHQRVADEALHDFVFGEGLAPRGVLATDGFFLAVGGMRTDWLVDDITVAVGDAGHDGEVLFGDAAGFELCGKGIVCPIMLGDDDQAAGVAIESMDDAGASGAATRAELGEVVGQGAG